MLKRYSATVWILSAAVLAGAHGTAHGSPPVSEPQCPPSAVAPCEKAGPQSPRDIDETVGENPVRFAIAPPPDARRLCDIHFHKHAEHKARAYDTPADDGSGFVCSEWTRDRHMGEPAPSRQGCEGIEIGDTIEVHWVYTTCDVEKAPCLTSCFSDACANPQLRVEAQVFFLTNQDFGYKPHRVYRSGKWEEVWTGPDDWTRAGYSESPPAAVGTVEYLGSTTGSAYDNEKTCSPLQVTWSVRHECRPLSLASLDEWCEDNVFGEDYAHGARRLVSVSRLLSEIP